MRESGHAIQVALVVEHTSAYIVHGMINGMRKRKPNLKTLILLSIVSLFALAACTAQSTLLLPDSINTSVPATVTLGPTNTPTPTVPATPVISPTPLPSPTPTPRVHQVKTGETLGGIAFHYGVSLDALLKLNPEVNPNAMSSGISVLIPYETLPPANQTPLPTAITLPLEGLHCVPSTEQGVWCFTWAFNNSTEDLEDLIINFNLAGLDGEPVYSLQTAALLNIARSGEKIPAMVYFAPEMPQPFQTSAQFVSAIPVDSTDRYAAINLEDISSTINSLGDTAEVSGKYSASQPVKLIWLAAVALDIDGKIIGMRRWEIQTSEAHLNGEFKFPVYAAGITPIEQVLVLGEAQP
ncbi:MAG: hypothetical protein CVU39_14165 [Chloroflexi bacterium HGW-Chloroflexi-10]|nr:MAG: hypothetical protein CVU39_14165 [Chloroflexi bacterium HGW-Chloroflexi-10]